MAVSEGSRLGAEAARLLARTGCCEIAPGLTDSEFERVEREHGFTFADDHRAFLAAGLPLNGSVPEKDERIRTYDRPWPEWRGGDPEELRERLRRPVDGVLFDVEHNGTWHDTWGERPPGLQEALATARRALVRVPAMIPVYGHRFLPALRGTSGHPVLSIWQTDIVYYGTDLADYVHQEFVGRSGADRADVAWDPRRVVPFWRDFL
ncbi:hypothetical protein CFN78_25195 [Amycolatopsis antarctica]|uniref:SMI1/KNR4 family protein n=1 Tax=Amycolatopsis antarctica TaxID=1854586 RepID=A0A263CWD9_9PSEU|nr:hypothetical protein [Amycolatopsis antarctica]OZM70460.1 hypothetical protein CFN78_25195 [Amycolatopsis antarctica]